MASAMTNPPKPAPKPDQSNAVELPPEESRGLIAMLFAGMRYAGTPWLR